jgi:hypothetical protein
MAGATVPRYAPSTGRMSGAWGVQDGARKCGSSPRAYITNCKMVRHQAGLNLPAGGIQARADWRTSSRFCPPLIEVHTNPRGDLQLKAVS